MLKMLQKKVHFLWLTMSKVFFQDSVETKVTNLQNYEMPIWIYDNKYVNLQILNGLMKIK